ncbi:MAG TPA: DUF4401 domain-containing protein [Chitinophagales bacterium]|nr:DUF4401 domain-containing protein [Chitinophagales bacterium]
MHKTEQIPELLASLQPADGPAIEFNETAITKEYVTHYNNRSGIAIKVLIVCGGFLASLAFVAFMMLLKIFESEGAMLVIGLCFVAGALFVNRLFDKLIVDTLSVSLFLIGLSLAGVGLGQLQPDENMVCLFYLMLAVVTIGLNQGYVFTFIGVLMFCGSLLALIANNRAFDLIHLYILAVSVSLAWWMLNEARLIATYRKAAKLFSPVRTGLVFSLLVGLASVGKRGLIPVSPDYIWLSSAGTIGIIMYLVATVLALLGRQDMKYKGVLYAACIICLLPTALSPAISGAVLILLLSFMVNYKTGVGIAITALAYFIGQYYYDLNFTLLEKSGILFSSGVMLLVFYFFTAKMLGDEKV